MTTPNNLELKGDFQRHPFAELLIEIVQGRLSGSLRLSFLKQKCVIYFRDGAVVHAVSNARELRLFSVMLKRRKIDEKTLAQFPNLANDIELAAGLEAKGIFKKAEVHELTTMQIESIIIDALTWTNGNWIFSPLTRIREDLIYNVDVHKVLVDYGRCISSQEVYQRFRSVQEAFSRQQRTSNFVLQPHEQHALDCFNGTELTIEQVRPTCSLPESALLQSLYVLWLGGHLVRRDWNSAFSPAKIEEIRNVKVSLIKSADPIAKKHEKVEEKPSEPSEVASVPEVQITLEEYLERVENAATLYDVLGVHEKASQAEIKNAYFAMAKMFHPDRYHREEGVQLRRIQVAFTQIAHANETLKTPQSRESYNFKVKKELVLREKVRTTREAGAESSPADRTAEHGLESFEKAMEAINEEEYAAAAGHLSRAVHYSPQNALYHAYFGHALSFLEKQHHKAEASLQTAVKLDPKNPKVRMMLVEFFVDMKMAKRAVGELKRFLELVPENREAAKKLAELEPKSEEA